MQRIQLRYKDAQALLKEYSFSINKNDHFALVDDKILFINNEPCFFYHEQKLFPTLTTLQKHLLLKKITVDMGAVRFVVNGADIMRPGIVDIEEGIFKNEAVMVIDEKNKKPIAVGYTLFTGEEIRAQTTGKVIKTLHYVGDEIWKAVQK